MSRRNAFDLSVRRSRVLVSIVVLMYGVALGPLVQAVGPAALMGAILPVALAGYLLGLRVGLLVALLVLPLHVLVLAHVGLSPVEVLSRGESGPGHAVLVLIGLLAGRLSDLAGRLRQQARELAQQNHALRDEIAEHMQAEERLAESEQRFRSLLDQNPDVVLSMELDGRGVTINRAGAHVSGYAVEEWLGRSLAPLVVPEELERTMAHFRRAAQGEPQTYDTAIVHRDGHRVDVRVTNVPIVVDGKIVGVYGIAKDITERKRAEQERTEALVRERLALARAEAVQQMAEARAVYEATALNLGEGLAIVTPDHQVLFWNRRMEELLGIPSTSAVARPYFEVLEPVLARTANPEGAVQAGREATVAVLAGGTRTLEFHLRGDPECDLRVLVFPVRAEDGRLLGTGRLFRDVTHERELERAKDDLVALVSHELRTPLASLVGFAELLLTRDYSESERREFLDIMHREGRRLTDLLNQFLDLHRLGKGHGKVVQRPTDLRRLLRDAAVLAGRDPAHPVLLEVRDDLPAVSADPDRLQQVLANLLSNASKYSPSGGEIRVSARRIDGDMVEVAVQDQGIGLPADALPRLFERFYRIETSDREGIGGAGLGLAISREIVEAHGGRIRAESPGPGRGSTFRFTLPVAEPVRAADVLLVEEEAGFAHLLKEEFAVRGYSTAWMPSAEAALQELATIRPRAVVLDLALPGLSGEACVRRLRELPEGDLPVVVVTGQEVAPAAERLPAELRVLAVYRKGPSAARAAAGTVARALERAKVTVE
jgi:PAS domain S-box-containing protein